jgi:hypothetical protein
MKEKIMRLIVALCLALVASNSNAGNLDENKYESSSLCVARDKIFFSCTTKKSKIISLCGKIEKGALNRLYYRFGKKGLIELEYPKAAIEDKDSLSLFYYNHYTRFLANYYTVTFYNHGYIYVLQDLRSYEKNEQQNLPNIIVYDNPEQSNGVSVSCISKIISDLYPLTSAIACNKESALGCEKGKSYWDGVESHF